MLECFVRIEPDALSDAPRLGSGRVGFEPIQQPPESFLVVASGEDWKDSRRLSRVLSRSFSAVRRIDTWNDRAEYHFVGIGGTALQEVVERLETAGPKPTNVVTLLSRDDQLMARVVSSDKKWLESDRLDGMSLTATRIYAPSWTDIDFLQCGLTDTELEVGQLAIREGYYEKPRGCTMSDMAEELSISKSAVYHRLSAFERKMIERNRDLDLSQSLTASESPPVSASR